MARSISAVLTHEVIAAKPVRKCAQCLQRLAAHDSIWPMLIGRGSWHGGFRFSAKAERRTSLDELATLIDWPLADFVLAPLQTVADHSRGMPPSLPS